MPDITPKADFQANLQLKEAWLKMVDSREMHEAVMAAFAQYKLKFLDMPVANSDAAAANYYRMEGAKGFLHELLCLADEHTLPKREPLPTLDHRI